MMNSLKSNQYFVFAIIFNEESGHKLRLGSSTIYAVKFGHKIFFRDRYGNIWPVKVEIVDGDIYFLDGWRVFAKHNYLEDGDVVVFYNGGCDVFDVKILGRDSSDKKGIGRRIIIGEPTVPITEFKPDIHYESYLRRAKAGEHHYASIRKEKSSDSFRGNHLKPKTPNICPEPYLGRGERVHYLAPNHVSSKREKHVDPFSRNFFQSHPDQRPKNPCFVTWLRKERVDMLFVPIRVVKKYKLNLPEKIKLEDDEGRKWDAELSTWNDGRKKYGGGLQCLCQVNFVTPDDFLICEFLRSEKKGLHTIRVHIFHP